MLHLLTAWREDVGALDSRRLHVGEAERPQVLHALLHLQLIAWPSYTKKKKKGQAVWKKYWKTLKSLLIFYGRKNANEFSLQTNFCSEFGLILNSDQHPTVWGVMVSYIFTAS